MEFRQPLPFFMAYPQYPVQDRVEKDRDYFRHLYPKEVKKYLLAVMQVLDGIDYGENFLYDEYPDRMSLLRVAETVMEQLSGAGESGQLRHVIWLLVSEEMMRRREKRDKQ